MAILKSFRNAKSLQLDSHKLLLSADYSQEVALRCKAFQPSCNTLFQKGIQFTLAYPAILKFTNQSGEPNSFTHPGKATNYIQAYLYISMDIQPPAAPSLSPNNRDLRSPKKD